MVDEADRIGFRYVTLPGHPEDGEEEFLVTRAADGIVRIEIAARSRPGRWFTRLGYPFAARVHRRITERYVRAAALAARGAQPAH